MQKIITCIDGSALASDVCDAGIWAAQRLTLPIVFLHAIERQIQNEVDDLSGAIGLGARSALLEEMAALDEQRSKVALQLGKDMLEAAVNRAQLQGLAPIEQRQRHGNFVEALVELQDDARLMVVGRSGEDHGANYKALGSHIENLIRQVSTPVVIATKGFHAPRNFMLAYDGRETADKAVERIIRGGLLTGMDCHVVSVKNSDDDLPDKFYATVARLTEHGFNVHSAWLEGPIFSALAEYQQSKAIELLVMGAFGHSKVRQFFLGSNTMKMIENTHIPLVILR